ncbi:MAG TPA: PEGA domain-containing protein [Kofleriaceae bacterium]|nr:PEGA domain-containing protein [Kofleriaceae bacterium]
MRLSRVAALAMVFSVMLVTVASADCPKTGRYSVKIDSAPPGAPIYIGDKTCQVGVTPWEGKLNKATYTVIIETPGYETATKQFVVGALRKQQELFVPLVKKADPPKLDIRADADPKGIAGATVSLDGEVKGQAPIVITTTAGRHQLRISKDGYEPFENWYTTTENNTQTVMPSLKEIAKPKYGVVVVDSDVPDAEVYIDGNKHPDNTPAVIQNVIEGLHVIEVRKQPALPWKQTVQVTAGQQTKVRAELQATLNGGVGVVRVLSDQAGARAFIDGTDMGPVPVDIKDVKAGEHIVQVKAPGMQAGEKKVTVAAGSSQIVKFDLNAEAAGDSGILKVVSMVPEAQVFIDGASVGKVPQEKHVSAGEHPVVVRLDGFKQFEQKVRVEAGQTVTVQATLKPVGRLRVLATPSPSDVIINGIPVGKTPLDTEVETGETVVRIENPGYQPFEQTLQIEGGKTQTLSRELMVAGPSEAELVAEQRGLSSFGARTLPRGRSTVDFSVGYPYYLDGRVTVGAGRIAHKFGFDASVAVRTLLARTEIGIGGRAMLADNEPFSFGVFTNLYWGSKLLDNSARNGLTWDAGILASLTALTHVTITGRLYLDVWSDRHCPDKKTAGMTGPTDVFDGDAIGACKYFYANAADTTNPDIMRITKLTGWTKPDDVFGRENGVRLMASIIAELAIYQNWNAFGILEGAPFQSERAFFTNEFAHSMFDTDFNLYVKVGLSYKF